MSDAVSGRVEWRIFYDGDATFSNLDGPPDVAPPWGVLAIVSLPDLWRGGDIIGLTDYLAQPGWKRVLFGRTVANDDYEKALLAASYDPDRADNWHISHHGDFYWYRG